MEDQDKVVTRSALHFLSGTFLSRFAGLFREISMAICFGATPLIAAFFVAYRFSNLIRRLFGESALLSGFSPYFESAKTESVKEGAKFFRDLFATLLLSLGGILAGLELGLFFLGKWSSISLGSQQMIYLIMLMLPGSLFICLYALFSAFLQCEKKFFIPGVAPVAFNFISILSVWLFKDFIPFQAMVALSISVVIAFLFQWIVVIPSSFKILKEHLSFKEWMQASIFSLKIRKMMGAMLLTIIGIGAVQINTALDTLFARAASLSGPAYLSYAIRFHQLPLSLFGISLGVALLPSLARLLQSGDQGAYHNLLQMALKKSFALMFPATAAVFLLGFSSVRLVYGHGAFDIMAVVETTKCLWGYALGLVPAVFVLLLAPAFYAQKDFKTPLRAALFSVALNIFLNALFVFVFKWGAVSIAVATSVAALFNYLYLFLRFSEKVAPLFDRETQRYMGKMAIVTMVAGTIALWMGGHYWGNLSWKVFKGESIPALSSHFFGQLQEVVATGGLFLILFIFFAKLAKVDQFFFWKKK